MAGVKILHIIFVWYNRPPQGIMQLTQFEAFKIIEFNEMCLLQSTEDCSCPYWESVTTLLEAEPDLLRQHRPSIF